MLYEFSHLLITLVVILAVPSLRNFLVPQTQSLSGSDTSAASGSDRNQFFDVVKGVAILAVVLIHVTRLLAFEGGFTSALIDVWNNLLRFAISFFLISSGVLLAAPAWRPRWFAHFYGRRLLAVGVPYAIVVAALGVYHALAPVDILLGGLLGTAALPFYFVPLLFQLYAVYPFVYQLAQRRWFVWTTLGFSFISYFTPVLHWAGELVLFTSYLLFFVWGMYLSEPLRRGTLRVDWLAGVVIVGIFLFCQTFVGVERFYNAQYFYGIAAFLLLYAAYHHAVLPASLRSGLAFLGERSLWIFLTHFGVLVLLFPQLAALIEPPAALLVSFTLLGTFLSVVVGVGCAWMYRLLADSLRQVFSQTS